jgi:Ca-activated chloride channel family protein
MLCEDIKPNRLTRAKQSVSRLIDKLQNDRIGIVAFAGEAYLQLPMTTDYSAAKLFLNTIDTDLIPAQGTAIGAAIELAVKSFREDDDKHKALIIITDGENHEDDAVGYASEAASKGVIIHTIGMGTVNGGPIPIMQNGNRVDFAKDNEGNVIMTKADPTMLQQLAQSGKGKFIRASETDPELSLLLDEIAGMEKRKFESKLYTDYEDRFQYFFFAALVLMIGEIFLSERRNKYLSSLNLFGDKK